MSVQDTLANSITFIIDGLTLTAKLVLGVLAGATCNMFEGDIKVDMGMVHTVLWPGTYTTREPELYRISTSEIHIPHAQ